MVMQANRKNMPPGFVPPWPAWQATWRDAGEAMVAGHFGIQGERPTVLDEWARAALIEGDDVPFAIEQGAYRDSRGVPNHLYIAYWRESAYRDWWRRGGNRDWWEDDARLDEGAGYWREIVEMPFHRFETLHSSDTPSGVSVSADAVEGPVEEHGYPGSMRDRLPLSATTDLRNSEGVRTPFRSEVRCARKRVRVTPPENMCVIRSGQDWSLCDDREKEWYLEKVRPRLLEGMRYLRDNPVEAGCFSLRFVTRMDAAWQAEEHSFGLGYAADIHAFEAWANTHPTHLAILASFGEMIAEFRERSRLQLWHETTVLPEGCEFEYIGCHSDTGLLGFGE